MNSCRISNQQYIYIYISSIYIHTYITDKPSQSASQINQPINQQTPAFGLGKAVEIGTSTAGCAWGALGEMGKILLMHVDNMNNYVKYTCQYLKHQYVYDEICISKCEKHVLYCMRFEEWNITKLWTYTCMHDTPNTMHPNPPRHQHCTCAGISGARRFGAPRSVLPWKKQDRDKYHDLGTDRVFD